jgi:hypothetical protein
MFYTKNNLFYGCVKSAANRVAEMMPRGIYFCTQKSEAQDNFIFRIVRNYRGISNYPYPISIISKSSKASNSYSLFRNYSVSFYQVINIKFRILMPDTFMVNRYAVNYSRGTYYYKMHAG